jgi:hypothetical protein
LIFLSLFAFPYGGFSSPFFGGFSLFVFLYPSEKNFVFDMQREFESNVVRPAAAPLSNPLRLGSTNSAVKM